MNIAQLFARIGIKADTQKADKITKQLNNIKIGMAAAATGAVLFSLKLKDLVKDSLDAAAGLKQFEAETGASTAELQKWQAVAQQTNNSAQAVAQSIKAITSNQEKIKLGQGNISGYQLLGIDPRQDPFKILEDLRVKTKGLSSGMKKNILAQVGVSSELLRVLNLTNEEFDKMSGNAFIIPPSAIATMEKARASSSTVTNAIKYLKAMIATELAPQIIKLNKEITTWIKNNEKGIVRTVKMIFMWIRRATSAIGNAAKMINTVVTNTIGWENAVKGLIAVFAILNAQLLFSPIGLIISGIILLIAVLDDLYVYSQGGKSLFGVLMKEFPELEKGLFGLWENFQKIASGLKALFKGDQIGIDNMVKELGLLGVAFVAVFETIKGVFEYGKLVIDFWMIPIKTLVELLTTASKIISGEITIGEGLDFLKKAAAEKGEAFFDKIMKFGSGVKEKIGNISNAWNLHIEVNTASTDPQVTADLVGDAVQKEINSASAQRPQFE